MAEASSTPAVYRPDLAIDLAKNRVGPVDMGGSRTLAIIRFVIATPMIGAALLCLAFGLWPATIVLVLIAIPFLGSRRAPRAQSIGVWEGNCPRCGTAAYPHAPPLADHYRFTCPGCTRPILLKDQRYEAA